MSKPLQQIYKEAIGEPLSETTKEEEVKKLKELQGKREEWKSWAALPKGKEFITLLQQKIANISAETAISCLHVPGTSNEYIRAKNVELASLYHILAILTTGDDKYLRATPQDDFNIVKSFPNLI